MYVAYNYQRHQLNWPPEVYNELGFKYIKIHSILLLITGNTSYFTKEGKFYSFYIRFLHKYYAYSLPYSVKYPKDYLTFEII